MADITAADNLRSRRNTVFFDRSTSPLRVLQTKHSNEDKSSSRHRRRLAALSLAVAMATPWLSGAIAKADEAAAPDQQAKPTLTPKEEYKLALEKYRGGQWPEARKHFEAAKGYKPGLFEGDRPEVYLARMDKKENAERIEAD